VNSIANGILKEVLSRFEMTSFFVLAREAGESIKPGWSEAEPQDRRDPKYELAKRATAIHR